MNVRESVIVSDSVGDVEIVICVFRCALVRKKFPRISIRLSRSLRWLISPSEYNGAKRRGSL